MVEGFYEYGDRTICSDQLCPALARKHFHCAHPRCLYITTNADMLQLHSQDFHETTRIPEGFLFIDGNINCRMASCPR